jgi:hypothetical protein
MDTGGYTALDPSRQSYQLQREGSLAFKGPNILTAANRRQPPNRPAQTPPPDRPPRSSASYAADVERLVKWTAELSAEGFLGASDQKGRAVKGRP